MIESIKLIIEGFTPLGNAIVNCIQEKPLRILFIVILWLTFPSILGIIILWIDEKILNSKSKPNKLYYTNMPTKHIITHSQINEKY